jgi:oxaloacetate decarboxylase gamma subunit
MNAGTSLLEQGLNLMLFGMSTVFLFLALLVLAMTTMSRLLLRLQPQAVKPGETQAARAEADEATVAAISLALHQHRQQHGPPRQRQ